MPAKKLPDRAGRYFLAGKEEGYITCSLCPRACSIGPGPGDETGKCKVRYSKEGRVNIPYYGYITTMSLDPIEKKPLYHFRPGSLIGSMGFAGCNLHCPFCQNWRISQSTDVRGASLFPEDFTTVFAGDDRQIAYTYSEPLVHIEFLSDCMSMAREAGIANVLVSNGCINSRGAKEVLGLCDAANIDLKCFSAETYSKVLGGDLDTVLAFLKTACRKGVHLEICTLVVPGLNDSWEELEKCALFIAGLSRDESGKGDIPWHLSAYHPDFQWKARATPPETILEAARRAREELRYVYTGNIPGESNDTACPRCGAVLVSRGQKRRTYDVDTSGLVLKTRGTGLKEKVYYHCAACGAPVPIRC